MLIKGYKRAEWRNTSSLTNENELAIGFTLEDGDVVKLQMPLKSAQDLFETIAEKLFQALRKQSQPDKSSGNPNTDMSAYASPETEITDDVPPR